MSQTALQLQQQLVQRWKEMDAQYRYSNKKRSRDDEEDDRPRSRTLNVEDVSATHHPEHEIQPTPARH